MPGFSRNSESNTPQGILYVMSPSPARARSHIPARKKGIRKTLAQRWLSWWPVLLGIAVTPIAMRAADVLALRGPDGLIMVYPYVVIIKNHLPWVTHETSENCAQAMMYIQFILYGLFLKVCLRSNRLVTAVLQTVVLHGVGAGFLIALARWQ
jgi:hypothetical protein